MSSSHTKNAGWPEIAVGLIIYLIGLVLITFMILSIPDEKAAFRGIMGMAANGVAGILALTGANLLRIRKLSAFGFRPAPGKWLLAGIGLGIVAVGLSFLIEHVYFHFISEANTQGDFQAASKSGLLPFLLLFLSGAILTPLGEEFLFRGVIANALNRYRAWISVVGGALIFAAVHGPSVIFVNAFMVGILTGILFRRTNSVWPGVLLHVLYNGTWLVIYSLQ